MLYRRVFLVGQWLRYAERCSSLLSPARRSPQPMPVVCCPILCPMHCPILRRYWAPTLAPTHCTDLCCNKRCEKCLDPKDKPYCAESKHNCEVGIACPPFYWLIKLSRRTSRTAAVVNAGVRSQQQHQVIRCGKSKCTPYCTESELAAPDVTLTALTPMLRIKNRVPSTIHICTPLQQ